jgi:hypothetical protein
LITQALAVRPGLRTALDESHDQGVQFAIDRAWVTAGDEAWSPGALLRVTKSVNVRPSLSPTAPLGRTLQPGAICRLKSVSAVESDDGDSPILVEDEQGNEWYGEADGFVHILWRDVESETQT